MASKKKVTNSGENDMAREATGMEEAGEELQGDRAEEAVEMEQDASFEVSAQDLNPLYNYIESTLVEYLSVEQDWRLSSTAGMVYVFTKPLPEAQSASIQITLHPILETQSLLLSFVAEFNDATTNKMFSTSVKYEQLFRNYAQVPTFKEMEDLMFHLRSVIQPKSLERHMKLLNTMSTI